MKYGYAYGIDAQNRFAGLNVSAEALAYRERVESNSGTVSDERLLLLDENLFTAVPEIIAELDVMWVFAAENAVQARTNLAKDGHYITPVNAPTFTADTSYQGDGASSYLDANYNPSTQGVKYLLNNASFGVFIGNNNTAVRYHGIQKNTVPATYVIVNPRNGGNASTIINSGGSSATASVSSVANGLSVGRRSGSGSHELWKNGVQINSAATASSTIPNGNIFLGASNDLGVGAATLNTDMLLAAFAGASLTEAQQLSLYNALRTTLLAINPGLSI